MTRLPAVRTATEAELAIWDELTVQVADGDVKQSLAWASHRGSAGWRVHHLATDDGGYALALGRPWPIVGGGQLYLPRGPVGAGATEAMRADRLAAIAVWARDTGYDEIVSDAEVPTANGYHELLAARGFTQTEEIEPSRHRMSTVIPAGTVEAEMRATIDPKARQPFTAAERNGLRVVRHDVVAEGGPGDGFEAPAGRDRGAVAQAAFERFHTLLASIGEKRGFRIGAQNAATAWWQTAMAGGHLVHLEVRGADDIYLGGAIFMRHGTRLTYAHAADVVSLRGAYPGVAHLALWRALQLAIREGRTELDLGGVDVAGARHQPQAGDSMFGLFKFKLGFCGTWVEQTGAHARVLRPGRRTIGLGIRAAGRAARRSARLIRER